MLAIGDVDSAGLQAVEGLIGDRVCRSATYHATAASTNSLALDDLRSGQIAEDQLPRLYLADRQTAGRGRHGRTWSSNEGTLTFSILADRRDGDLQTTKLLSLCVGVGVARGIEFAFAPLKTRLKWPNDVYIDGGKVAGILLESKESIRERVVIGVGVNVNRAPEIVTANGPPVQAVRSIAQVTGRTIGRYELLAPLVVEIVSAIAELREDPAAILSEFRLRCALTGRQVTYRHGNAQHAGLCTGVSDDGQLQVETPNGLQRLESGEANLLRTRHRH